MILYRLISVSLSVAALLGAATVAHGGNDRIGQRLAAELVIMRGDIRLLGNPEIPKLHKQGLLSRLKGSLSVLPVLLREDGDPKTGVVDRLRNKLEQNDRTGFSDILDAVIARHPLDLSALRGAKPEPNRLNRAHAIHNEACSGCHDTPDPETPLPARNLFKQARRMSLDEFAARLLNGVRGDSLTSLANPLSTEDISSLLVFYRNGMPREKTSD